METAEKMPVAFVDKVKAAASSRNSWLCVGLDPTLDRLPEGLPRTSAGVVRFCHGIVEATSASACAFKPNIAFFEALGSDGYSALKSVLNAVPDAVPVILDAKRGDIGNTARMYAEAYYGDLGVDAVTVSPYMGWDAVEPFAAWPGKAAFVLCLTSNASAGEMQMLRVGDAADDTPEPLFVRVARLAEGWGGSYGLVVGATRAEMIGRVRDVSPDAVLLVPGVGTQGGDLESSVRLGSCPQGGGAIVNASRSVLFASSGPDYATRAADVAEKIRQDIERASGTG